MLAFELASHWPQLETCKREIGTQNLKPSSKNTSSFLMSEALNEEREVPCLLLRCSGSQIIVKQRRVCSRVMALQ